MAPPKSKLERDFQSGLIKDIKKRLPGCVVLKQDPNYMQGIPDLLVLWGVRWALLEVKASADADEQPNQGYYVEQFNGWSFAAFIYPENKEDVLDELQQAFGAGKSPFLPEPQQASLGQLQRREARDRVSDTPSRPRRIRAARVSGYPDQEGY